jgi:Lrp/AsnC family transcriptional regulator of ectoine degradation
MEMTQKQPAYKLDRYDLKMLRLLAEDGRITKAGLAEAVNLSPSPAWERMKKLEAAGFIRGYRAVIDWSLIFPTSQILVEIELARHTAADMRRFESHVAQAPEVASCFATGGGLDYLMLVRAKSIDDYQAFMEDLLERDIGIERYYTYVVTKVVKDGLALPPDSLFEG